MKRFVLIFLGLVVAAAGITVAVSLHQPPMRLMPAPAVFLDERTNIFSDDPARAPDPEIRLFYATNREAVGTGDDREYARVPGSDLHAGVATIRIGDEDTTWERIYEWSTRSVGDERRPFLHLWNVDEQATIEANRPLSPEAGAWFETINNALAASRYQDLIVYVHGANTNLERAAGQAAQLQHFTGRNAVALLFAWPTAENFLLYSRDMLTAAQSAPQLARLIALLAEHAGAERIDVFTYSAGATVGSQGLAIVGRALGEPGAPPNRLGQVYHAAPDADLRSFVDEMRHYASRVERTTVAVNMSDSALRLSQRISNASRAGRPDMQELSPEETAWLLQATRDYRLELLRVLPESIPGLSNRSHTFWYQDPWVSSDVLITLLYGISPQQRGLAEIDASFGTQYWTFTSDYPTRLSALIDGFLGKGNDEDAETVEER